MTGETTTSTQKFQAPRRGLLLAVASALLFGAAAPASKGLLNAFSPLQLAGIMYLGAALACLPFALKAGWRWPWTLNKSNQLRLFCSLLFGGLAGPVLLLAGLKLASAGSVSMWLNLEVIFTTVLACVFFKEHLSARGWLAVAGGVLAAAALSWSEGQAGLAAGVLVGLACLCWAIDNNCTATLDEITPPQMVLWKGITAGSINLALGLIMQPAPDWQGMPLALMIGALCFGTSIVLYIGAAQQLGASRSQMVFAAAPFFGLALSALFLGEGITPLQSVAAVVMVGVIALLFRDSHSHEHRHEALKHLHEHSHDDGHHDHEHGPDFDPKTRHSHEHEHEALTHAHAHLPDLHHRHGH